MTFLIAGVGLIATSFWVFSPGVALASTLLGLAMIMITISDARTYIIPDVLSLPMIPIGLLVTYLLTQDADAVIANMVAGALAALGLYALNLVYRHLRHRDGLGLGDVKLAAAAGTWTGSSVTTVLLCASLAAILVVTILSLTTRQRSAHSMLIPFGVFLAPALWLIWCLEQLQ